MLRPGMRTSSIFNTHLVATRRKKLGRQAYATCCAQQCWVMHVTFKCCDGLAGVLLEEYTEDLSA